MHESSEWIEIFRVADPRKPSERSVTETDADQDQLPFAFAQRELPLWSTKQGRPPGSVISQSRLQRLRRFSNACALIIPYSYSKHTYSIDRPLLLSFFLFNKIENKGNSMCLSRSCGMVVPAGRNVLAQC
jgi:hypothetical protein